MASPGDARADGPPSPHRGAPFRGSWLLTWAGDDTRPAGQQTVLKSGWCEGILIMGLISVIPSWSSGPHLPAASLTLQQAAGRRNTAVPSRKRRITVTGARRTLYGNRPFGRSTELASARVLTRAAAVAMTLFLAQA